LVEICPGALEVALDVVLGGAAELSPQPAIARANAASMSVAGSVFTAILPISSQQSRARLSGSRAMHTSTERLCGKSPPYGSHTSTRF
jgi:hypothetical protein